MGRRAAGKGIQVISAFQGRDKPSPAGPASNGAELRGRPSVVLVLEIEPRQRVICVGIETGGDYDQLG